MKTKPQEQEMKNLWISTEKEFPPDDVPVLVFSPDPNLGDKYDVAEYDSSWEPSWQWREVRECTALNGVTHWQPLLSPGFRPTKKMSKLATVTSGKYKNETVGVLAHFDTDECVCQFPMRKNKPGKIKIIKSERLRFWTSVKSVGHRNQTDQT